MTKWRLAQLLFDPCGLPLDFIASNGTHYYGILQSIERADGSSFNLTVANQSGKATFHMWTTD